MENVAHELAVDCIYSALVKIMETTPYNEITITEITRRAGVSRMAYYRNYSSKDDILLSRLQKVLQTMEGRMKSRQNLSEEAIWRDFVESGRRDPVMAYILKAGLVWHAFPILKNSLIRVYTEIYHWDLADQETPLIIYERLGSLFGYMMFMFEAGTNLNTDIFLKHIMSLGKDKVRIS